jgi:hypothetical protein
MILRIFKMMNNAKYVIKIKIVSIDYFSVIITFVKIVFITIVWNF